MKVKVCFELDLSGSPYNVEKISDLVGSLQNLGSWLNELNNHYLDQKLRVESETNLPPEMKDALREAYKIEQNLSKQLFNNYSVSGRTEDGHDFEHNHKEPGYREQTFIDGEKADII